MKRLAITSVEWRNTTYTAYIALDENRDFVDFQLFEPEEESCVGRIAIGRVSRILPNIQAVFVRITPELECYLPYQEAEQAIFTKRLSENKPVCQGDELIVQVTKDAVRTKKPVVSAALTLTGSYSVLTTANCSLSVSRKLSQEFRDYGKRLLGEACPDHEAQGYGIVLRTNAAQASEEEIREDIHILVERYRTIRERAVHLAAFSELYRSVPGYIRRLQTIRDFSSQVCVPESEKQNPLSVEDSGDGSVCVPDHERTVREKAKQIPGTVPESAAGGETVLESEKPGRKTEGQNLLSVEDSGDGSVCVPDHERTVREEAKQIPGTVSESAAGGEIVLESEKLVSEMAAQTLVTGTDREDGRECASGAEKIVSEMAAQTSVSVTEQLEGHVMPAVSADRAEYDGIYTDRPEIYDEIAAALPYLARNGKLVRYEDPLVSLSILYNIRGNIEKLLARQVWLPSGANLVIDTVEAMTVIDVNTAKNLHVSRGRDGKAATVLAVNKEAAREIARQLRLRNISGIIVVDFINMEDRRAQEELIRFLREELKKDVVPCKYIDLTKLGLVELTRKKVRRSLAEIVTGKHDV